MAIIYLASRLLGRSSELPFISANPENAENFCLAPDKDLERFMSNLTCMTRMVLTRPATGI